MRKSRLLVTLSLVSILTMTPDAVADKQSAAAPAHLQHKYTVDSPIESAMLDAVDPITFEECDDHYTGPDKYWFKNKFNACHNETVSVDNWELENGVPTYKGSTLLQVMLIGQALTGTNQIEFGVLVDWESSRGKVNPEHRFSVSFGCLNAEPGTRTSTCAYQQLTVEKTLREWQADLGQKPLYTKTTATTTAVPESDGKLKPELRGFFAFDVTMIATNGVVPPSVSRTPMEYFRCDSATYVSGPKCVFNRVVSTLVFDLNNPTYSQSAQFIKKAQEDITQTKPGLAGTKVPGRLDDRPLTRMYSGYDTGKKIDGSRRKIRRVCRQNWGAAYTAPLTPGGPKRQCDEYPFATTYENAALVDENTVWSFAVEAIAGTHNETAGRLYGAWLGTDHLLDGDPFFVVVR
jgi:hypothetical protein